MTWTIARAKFRKRIFKLRGKTCAYCGVLLTSRSATLDHLLPLSRGGSRAPDNVVVSCRACNETKRDRTPAEWAADILAAAAAAGGAA